MWGVQLVSVLSTATDEDSIEELVDGVNNLSTSLVESFWAIQLQVTLFHIGVSLVGDSCVSLAAVVLALSLRVRIQRRSIELTD